MDVDKFFSGGHTQTLTNSIASFLKISPDRIRVVNVRKGSAIVDFSITPDPTSIESNNEDDTKAELTKIKE